MSAGGHEEAVLAGGCFWCLEAVFAELEGVASVLPGYCGGSGERPSYQAVCSGSTGHAEAVKITFDPARLPYRELLAVFFAIHDPTTVDRQGNDVGSQYRSAIFAQSPAQAETARALIAELTAAAAYAAPIVTAVQGAAPFWPAEDGHHDYYARNPHQPYCQAVVAPKLAKFRRLFAKRAKTPGGSKS